MDFLYFLAEHRTVWLNAFFQGVTYLGQEALVIAIVCWLYWCSNKKLAFTLGFSYFSSGLLIQGLKVTFRVPRPWVLDPQFQPVATALAGATGYSFPSGHTQSITALMGTFFLYFKNKIARTLCILTILLVGFSRMYLGCHTPQDVCTALILSGICVYFCSRLFTRAKNVRHSSGTLSIVMTCICFVLLVYVLLLYHWKTLSAEYASDCIKACGAGTAFALGYYIEETHIRFSVPVSFGSKILRFLAGLTVTLALQVGLKPVLGTSFPADFLRYFLTVCWILFLYPLLFQKTAAHFSKKKSD